MGKKRTVEIFNYVINSSFCVFYCRQPHPRKKRMQISSDNLNRKSHLSGKPDFSAWNFGEAVLFRRLINTKRYEKILPKRLLKKEVSKKPVPLFTS